MTPQRGCPGGDPVMPALPGDKMKKLIFVALFAGLLMMPARTASAPAATSKGSDRDTPIGIHREVAVTFDDLPGYGGLEEMRSVIRRLLRSLASNKVPAIGFVNESKLYVSGKLDPRRTALLQLWLDAGLQLGNHTFSHPSPKRLPLPEYEADVIRGETVTKPLLHAKGMELRYFRHPQLETGPTVEYKKGLDSFLAGRGYAIAPVTLDNNDFIFAYVYAHAKARGDKATMKRVADAYIPYMEQIFGFFEQLSVESFGYEVKQTLLLHANEINADFFDELVRMMKRRGYSFITLEEALKDKAYGFPDAQVNSGLSWIHRWRLARGLELRPEPREPQFLTNLYKAISGFQ